MSVFLAPGERLSRAAFFSLGVLGGVLSGVLLLYAHPNALSWLTGWKRIEWQASGITVSVSVPSSWQHLCRFVGCSGSQVGTWMRDVGTMAPGGAAPAATVLLPAQSVQALLSSFENASASAASTRDFYESGAVGIAWYPRVPAYNSLAPIAGDRSWSQARDGRAICWWSSWSSHYHSSSGLCSARGNHLLAVFVYGPETLVRRVQSSLSVSWPG